MSQEIIGRAWIGVGIRDETRQAIAQMRNTLSNVLRETSTQATRQLVPLDTAIRRVASGGRGGGSGTGGFGAGRSGGREFGSFGGWNQLAFGVEDAVVSYQLNGFAGATRAVSNNLTSAALAFGGLKAQIIATGVVVALQLLPAFASWLNNTIELERRMKGIASAAKAMRAGLQNQFELAQIDERVRKLDSGGSALSHLEDLNRRRGEISDVQRPALQSELEGLQKLRQGLLSKIAGMSPQGIGADAIADIFGKGAFDQLGTVEKEIEARQKLISQIIAQSDTIGQERAETIRRMNGVRQREAAEEARRKQKEARSDLDSTLAGLLGQLHGLTPENDELEFEAQERNRKLRKLFGAAGIDGSDALGQLDALDALRQRKRAVFRGLPDALSQFSVEGQRQFVTNQKNQYDPGIQHLREIRDAARQTRDYISDLLFELRDTD